MTGRRVETFRCPHDGRAVATLEADAAGVQWLVIVGGRDGHRSETRAELTDARDRWEREAPRDELFAPILHRLEDALRAQDVAELIPRRFAIPRDFDEVAHRIGAEPMSTTTSCPRCHRPTVLGIVHDGTAWRVVLR